MKKLLLSLLFSLPVLAQSNFRGEQGTLVWERSFPVANANVIAMADKEPNLKITSFMENIFKGTGEEIKNTCEGGSGLMKNACKFEFTIIVNPDSYIVKVKNLKVIEKFGPMQARVVANPLEKYFMNDTKMRADQKSLTDLSCLDNYLSGIFDTQSVTTIQGTSLTSN